VILRPALRLRALLDRRELLPSEVVAQIDQAGLDLRFDQP
jgi:hypothetical protein